MKVRIELIDKGSQSVVMNMNWDDLTEEDGPDLSPALVMGLATKALLENGMLAEAGIVALEALTEGKNVAEEVKEYFNK